MTAPRPVFDEAATPVIIAGAPRSGTTFLTAALNAHPQVLITNETRIWTLFNDIRLQIRKPSETLPEHPLRAQFRAAMLRSMRNTFHDFYRRHVNKTNLGCPASGGSSVPNIIKAYGDKNPGYADPNSKGALDFIARYMPKAKFIHIVRDPRSCVASYRDVAVYSDSITHGTRMWAQHVGAMANLRDKLGEKRVLELIYEDLVTPAGSEIYRQIEAHIGVDHADEPQAFLARERKTPVPYRSPVTPTKQLGRTTYLDRLRAEDIAEIEKACAELMQRYGYAPSIHSGAPASEW